MVYHYTGIGTTRRPGIIIIRVLMNFPILANLPNYQISEISKFLKFEIGKSGQNIKNIFWP